MNNNVFCVDLTAQSDGVSGSSYLLSAKFPNGEIQNVLIDAGLFHNSEGDNNETYPIDNLEGIILTHAHTDHIGRLPVYISNGYKNKVYCTETTKDFVKISLSDTLQIIKRNAKKNGEEKIFNSIDLAYTCSLLKAREYNEWFNITKNIEAIFFNNSHILGAAITLIKVTCPKKLQSKKSKQEPIYFLFTGDIKIDGNEFSKKTYVPLVYKNLDLNIICESTYGEIVDRTEERSFVFNENIANEVRENKSIVIPVLALGRCQEVLYSIRKLQDEGKIPEKYNIYLDGTLPQRYTDLINTMASVKIDFLPYNLIYVNKENRKKIIAEVENDPYKIFVCTSGNGTFGPSSAYLPLCFGDPNGVLHFTSYQSVDSKSRELLEASDDDIVKVHGSEVQKKATVYTTHEFSSHSLGHEILDFLMSFKNIKNIFLTHGEEGSKEVLKSSIMQENISENSYILDRNKTFRIYSNTSVLSLQNKIQCSA